MLQWPEAESGPAVLRKARRIRGRRRELERRVSTEGREAEGLQDSLRVNWVGVHLPLPLQI